MCQNLLMYIDGNRCAYTRMCGNIRTLSAFAVSAVTAWPSLQPLPVKSMDVLLDFLLMQESIRGASNYQHFRSLNVVRGGDTKKPVV